MNNKTLEDFVQDKVKQKSHELEIAAGVRARADEHFRRPVERPFTRDEKDTTTILFGGLTWRHEHLIEGALRRLGYKCKALPNPDLVAYEIGKEYQNNGYCNPAYFTIGNLIKLLQGLESGGMSKQEIIDNHVFLTAGACGTCRFGMYEAEYRLALHNAGFDGFRVLTFDTERGLDQSKYEAGLDLNLDFFLSLANALNMGDVLNQLSFQIRPYETEEGKTNRVIEEVLGYLHDVLRNRKQVQLEGIWKRLFKGTKSEKAANYITKFLHQLRSQDLVHAMEKVRNRFDTIEIDRFRVRPIVKLIGEFWAQITVGEGNFNMHRFLEGEGAEVFVDRAVGTRLMYMLHQIKQWQKVKKGLYEDGSAPPIWRPKRRLAHYLRHSKKVGIITFLERIYKRENSRLLKALGGTLHEIVDQYELERLARPYYNWQCGSGESHLEIAENIYYHSHDLCHMALSVKPFGCLPSTQSDGAQAAVVEHFDDMIYLPIETSGDGEIIAHSRVQMALGNARAKARREFELALASTGKKLEDLKVYVDDHPYLKRPTYLVPHRDGVVGRAALFSLHVADLMDNKITYHDAKTMEPEETHVVYPSAM